ncbi:MAG: hypothetical protein EKK48_07915 [Candidatus Melainabacteria bacterium]|nr:MAG: hypothetical protein EKK48_07915 [Candidatus Melainabacteria bacterium]
MFLKDHIVHPSAYHIGTPGRSQLRINTEQKLHNLIEEHLDSQTEWSNLESLSKSIHESVNQHSNDWCVKIQPRIDRFEWFYARRRTWLLLALILLLGYTLIQNYGLIWIPFAALAVSSFVILWSAILWHKNATDKFVPSQIRHEHIQQISVREDAATFVQNHFANVIDVKPGWFRRWNLRLVFLIASLTTPWSDKGELSGIPSIHFAHWALIDGGKKLLFLSNYDGSWENYLDDFIDKASVGLTGIWSNTVDFPPTKHYTDEGSRNGPLFKQYVRDRQSYSPVWYSAYPRLSVQNIDRNTEIAQGFAECPAGKELKNWFQKL